MRHVTLAGARLEGVDLTGAVMAGVDLIDVEVYADVHHLVINGVDVAPLIEAELDRREPLRPKMRPTDPAGFREAWDVVEQLWDGPDGTVARARRLADAAGADQLHASVDGEWSFIETLRHLAFATESWVGRGILGDPSPWHPLLAAVGPDARHRGGATRPGRTTLARRGTRTAPRPDGDGAARGRRAHRRAARLRDGAGLTGRGGRRRERRSRCGSAC